MWVFSFNTRLTTQWDNPSVLVQPTWDNLTLGVVWLTTVWNVFSCSILSPGNCSAYKGLALVNKALCSLPSSGIPRVQAPSLWPVSLCVYIYFFPSRLTQLYLSYFSSQTLWDTLIRIAQATFDIVDTSPAHRFGDTFLPRANSRKFHNSVYTCASVRVRC